MKVDSELGFVLHTMPYRETSLLVDLFSKNYGRIRCVAKGYRRPNKKGITRALFPYTEHQFSWQGRGELKTLTQADAMQAPAFLQSESLFTGLYVNELFYRLLHEHDPHEYLYQQYSQFLSGLVINSFDQIMLRHLEISLLEELGYGLALDSEALHGSALIADKLYNYVPERGLIEMASHVKAASGAYLGADLIALNEGNFEKISVTRTAKQLLRGVIDFYLDGRPLHSRELYRQHLETIDNKNNNLPAESR
ncbi:MAG TPA: DNA repair protein RecO [Porticoccaceae bacterium]|nr:DNA repair protein RecO [Porticoccaceae bacterium]HIG67598.1 DNA repair protein RecO [Porticoccaceae bacterium]HIK80230.1 DNA repair protein RecO [Porticoccaceae bacterium]